VQIPCQKNILINFFFPIAKEQKRRYNTYIGQ